MSQDIIVGRVVQLQIKLKKEALNYLEDLIQQLSNNKELAGVKLRHPSKVKYPTQSIVSQGTEPDYWNEKKQVTRDKVPGDVQDKKQSIQGSGDNFKLSA